MKTSDKKEQVLKYFTEVDGNCHLVTATAAFGMDINCPDIRRVLHWRLSSPLEEYIQESGQDGELSVAVIYDGNGGTC